MLVGPLPTPGVAMLTRSMRADLGVMISASHNPFEDNGIKLFGPDGYKLSDEMELAIEERMRGPADATAWPRPASSAAPSAWRTRRGRYIEASRRAFPRGLTLEGLRIVVDCANGAAYRVAPKVLWELGAEVIPVGVSPGRLQHQRGCGSTAPAGDVRGRCGSTAPISASRWTATPTAWCWPTRTAC